MSEPASEKIALVTGASRGLGAATSVELARLGFRVVLIARTQGGLEETDDKIRAVGGQATLLPFDLHDGDQLDALGPSLLQRFGRLDALVHCAASLGRLTPAAHILPKDWADVVAVNLAAAWRLIRTCGPLLQIAPHGRAVFVTDAMIRSPRAYWGAYGATKAGMEHLVLSWAEEIGFDARLRINLFEAGPMCTRLRSMAFPGEDPAVNRHAEDVAPAVASLCMQQETRQGRIIRSG